MYSTDVVELKKIMIERQINTTCALSKKSKVNRNTLSLLLNGSIQPSTSVMYRLAEALQLEPEVAGKIFFAKNLRNTKESLGLTNKQERSKHE